MQDSKKNTDEQGTLFTENQTQTMDVIRPSDEHPKAPDQKTDAAESEKGWLSPQTLDVLIFVLNITLSKDSAPDTEFPARFAQALKENSRLKELAEKPETKDIPKAKCQEHQIKIVFAFFLEYLNKLSKPEQNAFKDLHTNESRQVYSRLRVAEEYRLEANQQLAAFVWDALPADERDEKLGENFFRHFALRPSQSLRDRVKDSKDLEGNKASSDYLPVNPLWIRLALTDSPLLDSKASSEPANTDRKQDVAPPTQLSSPLKKSWWDQFTQAVKGFIRDCVDYSPFKLTQKGWEKLFGFDSKSSSNNWKKGGIALLNIATWLGIALSLTLLALPTLGWAIAPVAFVGLALPILEIAIVGAVLLHHLIDALLTDNTSKSMGPPAATVVNPAVVPGSYAGGLGENFAAKPQVSQVNKGGQASPTTPVTNMFKTQDEASSEPVDLMGYAVAIQPAIGGACNIS